MSAGPRGRDGFRSGHPASILQVKGAAHMSTSQRCRYRRRTSQSIRGATKASTEIKSSGKQTTTELLKFKLLIYMDNGTGAGVRCGVFLWQRFQETR